MRLSKNQGSIKSDRRCKILIADNQEQQFLIVLVFLNDRESYFFDLDLLL